MPDKKYQIIYADPPWSFNFQKRNGLSDEAKGKLYSTMKADDIVKLPVIELAGDDCISPHSAQGSLGIVPFLIIRFAYHLAIYLIRSLGSRLYFLCLLALPALT